MTVTEICRLRVVALPALLIALLGLSACKDKHVAWEDLAADDPRVCDFDVRWVDGLLVPFDPITQERIGYFERFEDPKAVDLFDGLGTVRDVTSCLKEKGDETLLTAVPLYAQ
ncbi:hypothetical protein PsyrH_22830 [Pseudomonas syringae pv. syringae HS191]|uniref:hypothetical protein n=1 Tax=Pseudomonas syringae TaxID=317 RepID=UPI0006248AAF|nr:hypothetical protein [Pseudomonas syringae]AKF53284.1 hypothetical protein PsyrH_22830 [Pseudomonas syringae pv. syringae HS191]RML73061.1 hypothetical protein ALQ91_200036 [Pseudomonas syringae pv. syringae]